MQRVGSGALIQRRVCGVACEWDCPALPVACLKTDLLSEAAWLRATGVARGAGILPASCACALSGDVIPNPAGWGEESLCGQAEAEEGFLASLGMTDEEKGQDAGWKPAPHARTR